MAGKQRVVRMACLHGHEGGMRVTGLLRDGSNAAQARRMDHLVHASQQRRQHEHQRQPPKGQARGMCGGL